MSRSKGILAALFTSVLLLPSAPLSEGREQRYDVFIRNGTIFDGSGAEGRRADLAIREDRIAAIGSLSARDAATVIDASGLAVAPGFINMLSWATDTLIVDGHSQSNIRQGVTLEIFGEGLSMGPLNEAMKREMVELQGDVKFDVRWTTLSQYMKYLEARGISPNVASFVGATTVRIHTLGYTNRAPSANELEAMKELVRREMRDGAFGVGSSLIYAPASFAKTEELIELAKAAGEFGGMYISHIRGEGASLLEAVDELIRIARAAKVPAEIYHLKAAGPANWQKLDQVIQKVEAARKEGLRITADMYLYAASATGLDAAMPAWVQEGGHKAWVARLKDPAVREKLRKEMADEWQKGGRSADKILLISLKNERLKPLIGKTLAQVARERRQSAYETAMDLVVEDDSRVGVVYFSLSEENIKKEVKLPWMSFGSDAESLKPEGVFLKSNVHPRAYGNFARLLGRYVREQKLIPLQEAIRRLTSFPAGNLNLDRRGFLKPGYFADVVVFDPKTIIDRATYEKPHQYSAGVQHVFVNGVAVLRNGEHTGATPGRVLRPRGRRTISKH
ncbi:MAG TPA: D-aminoacylase [Acidobacteriota bacterium]|nr:D-aminoacylase [Acidobacteriota bacterium]